MIKKTFKELSELDNMIAVMYAGDENLKNTKFGYAYKRFAEKNYYSVLKEYNEKLVDIRIDHALTDEVTKALLTTDKGRGFEYDKEGLKATIKEESKLEKEWDVKEFEVEPFFCKAEFLPKELTDEQEEMLDGILIEKIIKK